MRKIEKTVYNFYELSDEAKERAVDNHNSFGLYPWNEENRGSLESFENEFPVKVNGWSYGGSRSDGVGFSMTCDDEIQEMSGIRLRTYLINNHYSVLFERKPQGSYRKNEKTGKWSYKRLSNVFFQETSCPFTGYYVDEDILKPIRDFIAKPNGMTFHDLMSECFEKWVTACTDDYEYYFSNDAFAELCEANEYEFDENGNII